MSGGAPAPLRWSMQATPIATRWASCVDPSNAWPEYPRPQMTRQQWTNLNGLWEYAITGKDAPAPRQYTGHILVPYPLESALSGVKRALEPDELLWYRRTIHVASLPAGQRVLLHFGAVDCEATVYMNDQKLGTHSGGYQSFTFEITHVLKAGDNELVVKVFDPTERGLNPHGKQNLHAKWMFYTPSSGIWQTVWLEHVPATYIESLKLTPDVDRSELRLEVQLNGIPEGHAIEVIARSGAEVVSRQPIQGPTSLRIDQPRLWSPDDPHLYDLEVRVLEAGRMVDSVTSYFGMRKIELKRDGAGRARIHLNDRYTYNLGVVDQGFWPEGLYTAPSDAALKFDVQAVKALGFNTVRKHIKVEPQRWYYHCDRLGLLVWQDMPSSNHNDTPQARARFELELKENLAQLHNHPSITTWVLFNEGWGAYDQERLAHWMKQADPSRLLNGHSGPYDQLREAEWVRLKDPAHLLLPLGVRAGKSRDDQQAVQLSAPSSWRTGDIADVHFYPGPQMFPSTGNKATVTGEHGSFGVYIEGHVWDEFDDVGRGLGGTAMMPDEMLAAYADSIEKLKVLQEQGLSGSAYFEFSDVESEHQGFFTYDRAVAKVPVAEIARLHARLVPRAKNYDEATQGFVVDDAHRTSQSQRYEERLAEFRNGCRELSSLTRLALMALRLSDQEQATQVFNEFVSRAPKPFTKETWRFIAAMTRSSRDKGFEFLRDAAAEANALLGAQAAEKKIIDVITRELVGPYFRGERRGLDWNAFEETVADQHGPLGREAVLGARTMDELLRQDWARFGVSYMRYFATAIPRSPYSLHSLSYRILMHVNDPQVIEVAIDVMGWQIKAKREWPVVGQYDPAELDTYAGLLHRSGRTSQALEWQQRAVVLSSGRDPVILHNFAKMRSDVALLASS